MPAVMKMSSQPSALRSSTLGPQGQYVSTPTESETSANVPPPPFAKRAFPKMNRLLPVGKKSTGAGRGSALRASAAQSPPARDVLEPIAPQVPVEDAGLGALGVRVTVERVAQADIVASRPLGVAGINAHVRHEEIEQSVAIVVEEHRARRVADVPDAGLRGDVAEFPATQVLKQAVAVPHPGHEQVGVAVVVDVGGRPTRRAAVPHP